MKEIDLEQNIFELTEKYPELIEILKDLGFLGLASPIVRKTLGRKTTVPQGCKRHGKDLEEVIEKLKAAGFKVIE